MEHKDNHSWNEYENLDRGQWGNIWSMLEWFVHMIKDEIFNFILFLD